MNCAWCAWWRRCRWQWAYRQHIYSWKNGRISFCQLHAISVCSYIKQVKIVCIPFRAHNGGIAKRFCFASLCVSYTNLQVSNNLFLNTSEKNLLHKHAPFLSCLKYLFYWKERQVLLIQWTFPGIRFVCRPGFWCSCTWRNLCSRENRYRRTCGP